MTVLLGKHNNGSSHHSEMGFVAAFVEAHQREQLIMVGRHVQLHLSLYVACACLVDEGMKKSLVRHTKKAGRSAAYTWRLKPWQFLCQAPPTFGIASYTKGESPAVWSALAVCRPATPAPITLVLCVICVAIWILTLAASVKPLNHVPQQSR